MTTLSTRTGGGSSAAATDDARRGRRRRREREDGLAGRQRRGRGARRRRRSCPRRHRRRSATGPTTAPSCCAASAPRSATIGFVPFDVSNPFFSAIYRGLEDVAWANGYVVVAGSSDGTRDRGDAILKRLIGGRVDGLVVVPAGDDHTLIAEEVGRGTPVVLLDLEVDDMTGVDLVRSDHRGGARLAVEHLIAHGHRDIAYPRRRAVDLLGPGALPGLRRGDARRPDQPSARLGAATVSTRPLPRPAVRALFADGVDAATERLFSAQNAVTIGAVQALHELGLHRSVALVGFDDVDMADVVEPGLSVVPQRPLELGRLAGELLLDRIGGHRGRRGGRSSPTS